jgi:hypothetical protein
MRQATGAIRPWMLGGLLRNTSDRSRACRGLAGAVASAFILAPPAPVAAATPLSFEGARLGMSLAEWRALPPPPGESPAARPLCTGDPGATEAALWQRASVPGGVVCSYASVYGRDVLLEPAPLDQRYSASRLLFVFDHGSLSAIHVDAPVDAFDDVMALLTSDYGPPAQTVRDTARFRTLTLDRVRDVWRTPGGGVDLVAPYDGPTTLSVRFESPSRTGSARADLGARNQPGG